MTTFTIPAALPAAPNNTNRAPTDAHAQAEASTPSFSSVLTNQQSPKPAPETATPVEGDASKGKDLAQAAPEATEDTEEVPAELDAEQGLSLPQIALTIAAEAALAIAAQQPAKTDIAQADKLLPTNVAAGRDLPAMLTETTKVDLTPARVIAAIDRKDALPQTALPMAEARLTASDKPVALPAGLVPVAAPAAALPAGFIPVAAPAAALHQTELNARKPINLSGTKPAIAHDLLRSGEPSLGKATAPDLSAAIASQASKAVVTSAAQADLNASLQAGSIADAPTMHAALLSGKTGAPAGTGGVQFAMPTIATPLQNPQWASDFGRQFITLAKGGHNMPHTAELRLDPPELGPLRISINISDNVAHAIFTSPHAAVRQTVENSLPQLQQLLAQAGISLGQTSVNDQGQQESSFSESFGGSNKSANAAGATGGIAETASMQPTTRSRAPDALVDTFA